jgi:hypothetical protein
LNGQLADAPVEDRAQATKIVSAAPPALAYTLGSWCVTLAGIVYFSTIGSRPVLHPSLIIIQSPTRGTAPMSP